MDIVEICKKPFIGASYLAYILGTLSNEKASLGAVFIGALGPLFVAMFCLFMLILALRVPMHLTKEGVARETLTILCYVAFIGICVSCLYFCFIMGSTIH